jgi:predicted Fe-Mo cluster-binding NifX family protein
MNYKIALCSSDGTRIDLHFGHTKKFFVAAIDAETGLWSFLETKELPLSPDCREGEGCAPCAGGDAVWVNHRHENMMARVKDAVSLMDGCLYLLTVKIGPKMADLLKRSGITALESPPDINEAVAKLNKYHLKYGNINKEKNHGK